MTPPGGILYYNLYLCIYVYSGLSGIISTLDTYDLSMGWFLWNNATRNCQGGSGSNYSVGL